MKTLFKSLAVLLFAACVLGSVFAAGGQQGSTGEKTLTWIHTGAGTEPHDQEQRIKPIIEKFRQNTGIRIVQEFYMHSDLFTVIEVRIASGRSKDYDVLGVDVPMVASYASRGFIEPMDRYFTAQEKALYIPSAVEAGSWQGVFYAPPHNSSSQVLWYNKDLLSQAGITLRESDVRNRLTYEELTELSRQALDRIDPSRTAGIGGLMFEQISRVYQMNAIPNSMGERSIGPDGFTVEGVINTPGWVRALTWYQNLFKDGLALRGFGADDISNLFRSGRVIFLIAGPWNIGANDAAGINYGVAPVPAFRGFENKVATPTGSWHLGINKYSTKHDDAARFVKWMTMDEGNVLWLEVENQVPSTHLFINRVQNDPNAHPALRITAYEAANTAYPRALTPGFPEYSTIMDAMWEDVRNGSDVKRSLDSAVMQLNSAFSKYK